jgi:2-dehydro-3-deoxyphosphogluconate aldolase / (4S)-4-hydroxy-2-oxoglutarate aldolase
MNSDDDVLARIRSHGVVPVLVVHDAAHAAPLAHALCDGGIPCAEVTYRTPAAGEVLRRMREARPDMLVGAGTVLTPACAAEARAAGAAFIVSPGFNPAVVDYCQAHDIPIYPGVCTPTEIEAAMAKELRVLKFFPAEPMGGLRTLKAISAPYGGISFMPTGGIGLGTLAEYLAFDRIVACGGSWLTPAVWLRDGDFARVREETMRTVTLVRTVAGREARA